MKVSVQWLAEWVAMSLSTHDLAERLTMAGLEVDSVAAAAPPMSGVILAKVVETTPHPNADKLTCCRVDIGEKDFVDVVCGAPNVRSGLVVAYAKPGANLPDGRTIEHVVIRDVKSAGMLCSAAELCLSEENNGLLELAEDAPIGVTLKDYLQLDDEVIDIELTPNRGDCLSILGVAREVAALTKVQMKDVVVPPVSATTSDAFPIELDAPNGCPRYAGRVLKNVNAAASTPTWIQERLRRAGVRSISAVVDVTNYVMLELGQPMHGFDFDRLSGGIRVRNGRTGESLELLDGQTIELDPQTLVIADERQAVALAGVMGGAPTGVEAHTQNVFLESAYFDAITLAGVARRYRMHTDASHRFERGVDFSGQERAIERATALIIDICGGEPGPIQIAESGEALPTRSAIEFDPGEIERIVGIEVSTQRAKEILRSLNCQVAQHGDGFLVTPPVFRFDLDLEADLLEEIARVHGYDNLPATLPLAAMTLPKASVRRERDRQIRDILVTLGYSEAITYSFIEPNAGMGVAPNREGLALANPITADMAVMRTSIWPGLINAAKHNLNRQIENIRLFELGRVFEVVDNALQQRHMLAGIALGSVRPRQWAETTQDVSFFDIKQELKNVLDCLGGIACEWLPSSDPALHPGQAAVLRCGDRTLGKIGVLHPRVAGEFDLDQIVTVFELELECLPSGTTSMYSPVSKFPSVRRDISVVLSEQIAAGSVLNTVRKAAGERLRDLQLFDEYRGQGIDSDKKSLAMGLIFQAHSSTLTDEEIEETMERVLSQLHSDFGGTLRK